MTRPRFELEPPFNYGDSIVGTNWGCYETVPGVFIAFGPYAKIEQLTTLLNDSEVNLTDVWLHTGTSPGD